MTNEKRHFDKQIKARERDETRRRLRSDKRIFDALGMDVPHHNTACPAQCGGADACSTWIESDRLMWKCHRCDEAGDPIRAWMIAKELSFADAFEDLAQRFDRGGFQDTARPPRTTVAGVSIRPASQVPPPITRIYYAGSPRSRVYARFKGSVGSELLDLSDASFRDVAPAMIDGEFRALGVVRWDRDGKKALLQCHFDGEHWVVGALRIQPKPIYKMNEISRSRRDRLVIIVEGEKCMHALQAVCPEAIVTTSLGGKNAARHGYWACLARHSNIVLIPDVGGDDYAEAVLHRLPHARVLRLEGPEGFDVADLLAEKGTTAVSALLAPNTGPKDLAEATPIPGGTTSSSAAPNLPSDESADADGPLTVTDEASEAQKGANQGQAEDENRTDAKVYGTTHNSGRN